MKILKNLLIALAVIVVVAGIVLYFLPKEFTVSNSIEINRPAGMVYAQISDYNKWGTWDPWMKMDPDAKVTIEGTPGTAGQKMSWQGKKSGVGNITVVSAGFNDFIYSDLEMVKPVKSSGKDMLKLEAEGDKTKITWTNRGGLPFPGGRIFGLFVNKMYGKAQTDGLQALKTAVEAMPMPAAQAPAADSTAVAKSM
jgi:hypothetical protein